jgi:hypothetical protein
MSRKLTIDEFIQKSVEIHSNKYDYSLVEYTNSSTKVEIICKEHGIFEQTPIKHTTGRGCQKCGGTSRMNTETFIIKSQEIHSNKYDYSLVKYVNINTKVKIIYKGRVYEQLPNNHLSGFKCENIKGLTQEQFIEKSKKIHGDKYDYSLVDFKNVRGKVKIIYNTLIYEQLAYLHLEGKSPRGTESKNSKGEEYIESFLINNKIKYIRQYLYKDCRNILPLPFDFYLDELNILIEYDGRQHFESVDIFGGESGLLKRKINDEIKNNYCKKNRIPLLRISYLEDIYLKLSEFITTNYI